MCQCVFGWCEVLGNDCKIRQKVLLQLGDNQIKERKYIDSVYHRRHDGYRNVELSFSDYNKLRLRLSGEPTPKEGRAP